MKIKTIKASVPKVNLIIDHKNFVTSFKEVAKTDQLQEYYQHQLDEFFYIYEIVQKNGERSLSLICFTDIQDIIDQNILKHEDTLIHKADYLQNKLLEERFFSKPVMMFVDNSKDFESLLIECLSNAKEMVSFDLDFSYHKVYEVPKSYESRFVGCLTTKQNSFIADGHHRYNVIERMTREGSNIARPLGLYSAYMPENHLNIRSYHRSIKALSLQKRNDLLTFMKQFGSMTEISRARLPNMQNEMILHFNDVVFSFKMAKGFKELIISFLDQTILRDYLKYDEKDILYLDGNYNQSDIDIKKDSFDQFYVYPLSIETVKMYAKDRKNLPPKSTWFEPKIRSGLILANIY
jgi:uncharacterized protein (DUF1015 family)